MGHERVSQPASSAAAEKPNTLPVGAPPNLVAGKEHVVEAQQLGEDVILWLWRGKRRAQGPRGASRARVYMGVGSRSPAKKKAGIIIAIVAVHTRRSGLV